MAAAQATDARLRGRATVGGSGMVSADQVGALGYDTFGLLSDLQLGYAFLPWFEPQLAVSYAAFPAPKAGAMFGLGAGLLVTLPWHNYRPFARVEFGPTFTGPLLRPLFRAGLGLDIQVSNSFSMGPVLGYCQIFQDNGPLYSTDARFFYLGITIGFWPHGSHEPAAHDRVIVTRTLRDTRYVHEPPLPPREPEPPVELTPEMTALLDNAVPSSRMELLAPVLFKLDSDELEPIGVAMLHEVARELAQRKDIELLEIQGYADSRGAADYNVALSKRRAEHVRAWLVEHGVDEARLQVAAEGATGFVEAGATDETAHEQNRRVVFRVLRSAGDPP